ncbi:WD40 repeat domain-containing protein [Microcoleus sp. POL10_C6]|uniref:WD40 repeat domain-containing protein n=1 Tax=unclassified Microcoleus TaxID=2642155 RepID=UPI002FD24883
MNPTLKRLYFGAYPYNLIRSGNLHKYYELLCNFEFLLGKIQHPEFGVQALIEDYDLLDDSDAKNHPEWNSEVFAWLGLIQGALRLSAHVLVEDPTQLASQLWGRLQGFDHPIIHSLLQQINQNQRVWLRPFKSGLIRAGSRLQRIFTGHSSSINAIALTPDGKQIVSGADDGILKVWDLATGKELRSLSGHRNAVTAIIVTPDGKQVISGSKDGTLTVWNLARGEKLFTMTEPEYLIETIAVTSDSKWVTTSGSTTANGWNIIIESFIEGFFHQHIPYPRIIAWNLETREKRVILDSSSSEFDTIIAFARNGFKAISCSSVINKNKSSDHKTYRILRVKNLEDTLGISPTKHLEVNSKDDITITTGHTDRITVVAITPDGKVAISGSKDQTLMVWDLETQQQRLTLTGHRDEITLVAISDDGKKAVSGAKDKTLKIWNLETGKEISTLNDISNSVNSVVIASNSKQAFSCSTDKAIKIWDIEERESESLITTENIELIIKNIALIGAIISYVLIFLGLSIFIFLNLDFFTRVLFTFINQLHHLSEFIKTLFKSDLSTIARGLAALFYYFITTGLSLVNRFWLRTFSGLCYVYLVFFPFLKMVDIITPKINDLTNINVNESCKHTGYDWLESWNTFAQFHRDLITALAVTPDNKRVISGSNDQTIRVWDMQTGNLLSILSGHQEQVSSIALSSNGKLLISSSFDKTIKAWKTETLKEVFQLKSWLLIIHKICYIAISGVWVTLGIAIGFGILKYHPAILQNPLSYVGEFQEFLFIIFLISVSLIYRGVCYFIDEEYCERDNKVIITPDNERAITGSRDKTLKIWDLTTRRQIYTLQGHKDWIASVAVTLDSQYLISGSKDKTLKVWNLRTRKELFTLAGHSSPVTAVAVTPDGLRAISSSSDGSLKVWNLESREEILTIDGHRDSVEAIAVTPDGKHLVSAASDHTLRVWDLLTGEEITRFTADTSLTCCAIAPEGTTIVAGDRVGQLHFLRLEGIGVPP